MSTTDEQRLLQSINMSTVLDPFQTAIAFSPQSVQLRGKKAAFYCLG
jgi:hypothetical protein